MSESNETQPNDSTDALIQSAQKLQEQIDALTAKIANNDSLSDGDESSGEMQRELRSLQAEQRGLNATIAMLP